MPTAYNRRRPGGYTGGLDGLCALLADARAALVYAHELRARATRGEDVSEEVLQETIDLCFRSEALTRVAGNTDPRFFELMRLDGEVMLLLMEALTRGGSYTRSPFDRMQSPASANAARVLSEGAGEPTILPAEILGSLKAQCAAYRRAARRLHPDAGGDTAAFQHLERANRHLIRRRQRVDHG